MSATVTHEESTSATRARAFRAIARDVALVLALVATTALAVLVAVVHVQFIRVTSSSMEPTLGVGDVVIVREVSAMELHEGQMVVLPVPDEGDAVYVHRLVGLRDSEGQVVVTTKGDANPAADPWELRIDSARVPVVVGSVPMPGLLARASGIALTKVLLFLLGMLIAAPVVMAIMRSTQVGTRLRALPVRLSDRRRR